MMTSIISIYISSKQWKNIQKLNKNENYDAAKTYQSKCNLPIT